MSAANQAGQVSPDGMWLWDGARWVPIGPAGPPGRPRRSRRWLAAGVTFSLVMAAVAGVWGITSIVHNFQSGAFSCLPADFPRYPGTTVSAENQSTGPNGRDCRMTFESGDPVTRVGPYYQSKLSSGRPWSRSSTRRAPSFSAGSRPSTSMAT